jgi:2-polyprenyl-3-methyl-5-hydroxy-6-metoxy-1,4-benzoquinol methylase
MRMFMRRIPPKGRLLDVGCSTGRFLLAARLEGWEASGVDVSVRAAEVAAEFAGVPTTAGLITDVDGGDGFDAITAWETLEHVVDPVGFVMQAKRILRPGGALAISVPNWSSPWMRASDNIEHWPPYHLTFWEPHTLRALLLDAGFLDVTILEKPIAWGEEVGQKKWLYLPVAAFRAIALHQRGMHLVGLGVNS